MGRVLHGIRTQKGADRRWAACLVVRNIRAPARRKLGRRDGRAAELARLVSELRAERQAGYELEDEEAKRQAFEF